MSTPSRRTTASTPSSIAVIVQPAYEVVSEPPSGSADRWPAAGLDELGLHSPSPLVDPGPPPTHLMVVKRGSAAVDRYPRRVGVPAKRPVF